jgi:hypothetical protein
VDQGELVASQGYKTHLNRPKLGRSMAETTKTRAGLSCMPVLQETSPSAECSNGGWLAQVNPAWRVLATSNDNSNRATLTGGDPAVAEAALEIKDWSTGRVSQWLGEQEGLVAAASNAKKLDINGATLLKLDSEGWKELGVESAVHRAKLLVAMDMVQQVGFGFAHAPLPFFPIHIHFSPTLFFEKRITNNETILYPLHPL